MKKNLLSGIILVLFSFWGLLFSFSSDAQNDYHLLLQSGKFIPEENIKTLSVRDEVFSSGFFKGKHYVILQFYRLPGYNERESLKAAGVTLIDYIPNLSYTAAVVSPPPLQLLRKYAVRSVFHFKEIHKTFPSVLRGEIPMHAKKQPGMVDVSVISYEAMNASSVAEDITQLGGTMLEHYPHFRTFTIRIPQQNLKSLIQLPWIQWVEFAEAPNQPENLPGRTLHRVSVLNDGPRNLNGDGIHIGIWDGGEVSPHLDFSPSGRLNIIETSSPSQHATHCAGTICGRGLINFSARGMAPNATLYSYDFSGNVQNEMATAIPLYNLAVSSHSYGSSATPTCNLNDNLLAYTTTSRNTDINLNNFPFHLHVHSAGNSQSACSGGYYTITGSGKAAKNNIVVANITSMEVLSSSSSCGPVQDGRIKPEISAMGTSVFSTSTPLNTYTTLSGTSMSTPGVAGSLALLVQRFKQLNGNALPPSTLIKNAILNTAHDPVSYTHL
ncbi:MAG: S8 family serine peptidase, partial [Chitinophagaceae bacterium]|nr:S8 family serine peptidase [Chitinophagaceae bacterium]